MTQIARSRQSILRRIAVPDNWLLRFLMRWVPGVSCFSALFRFLVLIDLSTARLVPSSDDLLRYGIALQDRRYSKG